MSPRRIQRKRVKGWRLPEGARIVDRSSRWGNPFAVSKRSDGLFAVTAHREVKMLTDIGSIICEKGYTLSLEHTREEAHAAAVDFYAGWFPTSAIAKDLQLLRGHDLACPCPPELPCHADVLLEIANSAPVGEKKGSDGCG